MAGRKGAVTVATNMAGRGTDIMLGGNAEFMAHAELEQRGLDAVEHPDEYEAAWDEALAAAQQAVKDEHDEVVELGACTFWAPNATNHGVLTTSCVDVPGAKVTPVSHGSTCPWKTN